MNNIQGGNEKRVRRVISNIDENKKKYKEEIKLILNDAFINDFYV